MTHVAEAFQAVLPSDLEVTVWPDVFNVGEYALDDLRDAAREHDFAVFVFSPDDEVQSRGQASAAPRDNVVFEFGLFIQALGARRTFVLKAAGPTVKVPSDLAGVGYATYEPPQAGPQDARWESAVRTGARKIRRAIDRARTPPDLSAGRSSAVRGAVPPPAVVSAVDLLADDLTAKARDGGLAVVTDLRQGVLVVHPLHGVGQIAGFDPPGPDRTGPSVSASKPGSASSCRTNSASRPADRPRARPGRSTARGFLLKDRRGRNSRPPGYRSTPTTTACAAPPPGLPGAASAGAGRSCACDGGRHGRRLGARRGHGRGAGPSVAA